MAHVIINMTGKVLFETKDVSELIPFYQPEKINLSRIKNTSQKKILTRWL